MNHVLVFSLLSTSVWWMIWGSTQFTIACCCAIVLPLKYYHSHISTDKKYQEEGTEHVYDVQ